jgi:hypothetical protein
VHRQHARGLDDRLRQLTRRRHVRAVLTSGRRLLDVGGLVVDGLLRFGLVVVADALATRRLRGVADLDALDAELAASDGADGRAVVAGRREALVREGR